jgi:hypothetical protein
MLLDNDPHRLLLDRVHNPQIYSRGRESSCSMSLDQSPSVGSLVYLRKGSLKPPNEGLKVAIVEGVPDADSRRNSAYYQISWLKYAMRTGRYVRDPSGSGKEK